MPRNISVDLKTHIQGEVLTLAVCVKITRKDAEVLGFTSLDMPLVISSVTYNTTSSLLPTAVSQTTGTGVDNMEVMGILSSEAITDSDLIAGKYDGADIEVFLVNWDDLTQGKLILFRATMGEVNFQDGNFKAELRSQANQLKMQIGDVTNGSCRVKRFGDNQCKAVFTPEIVTCQAIPDDETITFVEWSSSTTNAYNYGIIRSTSGDNIDLEREIQDNTLESGFGGVILRNLFPYPVLPGDTFELEPGCDRTFETCRDTYANSINYQGEPDLPGNSTITQAGRPPG